MLFGLVISIHVVVCILLILVVMIQQGRGGGLIDSLSSAENILGTKTSTFLVKSTTAFATIFFITCLTLAFLSIQKGKSLIETNYKPTQDTAAPGATALNQTETAAVMPTPEAPAPAATTASAEVPVEAPAAAVNAAASETPAQK